MKYPTLIRLYRLWYSAFHFIFSLILQEYQNLLLINEVSEEWNVKKISWWFNILVLQVIKMEPRLNFKDLPLTLPLKEYVPLKVHMQEFCHFLCKLWHTHLYYLRIMELFLFRLLLFYQTWTPQSQISKVLVLSKHQQNPIC